jgi:hypothetical protein
MRLEGCGGNVLARTVFDNLLILGAIDCGEVDPGFAEIYIKTIRCSFVREKYCVICTCPFQFLSKP